MNSGGGGSGPGTKKSLQEMSREELVQKCKTLLAIAHKAKVAKDGKFAWWNDCFWFSYFTFFELLLFLMTGILLPKFFCPSVRKICSKGQLISKQDFRAITSPKKRM